MPGGVFEQVVVAVVLAALGYLTGSRVRKQDSGWERLLQSSAAQVSRLQSALSDAHEQIRVQTERISHLEDVVDDLRREAYRCSGPHPAAENFHDHGSSGG